MYYFHLLKINVSINYAYEDRAETAHACAKTRSFEPPLLPATDPEIRQHLIFSS